MNRTQENSTGQNDEGTTEVAVAIPRISALQVMGSTLAAVFGVQSKSNKIRDFEQGKFGHFIAAGLIFTAVFVTGMIALVNVIV